MVYVLDNKGQPLMPTKRHGKVRRLLNSGKAKVIRRCPFTIQLLYESTHYTDKLTLGIDAGSKDIGISVTSETKEYYASETELRTDIVELIATRAQNRKTRRSHKTRYREPRFNNRKRPEGWLAPSVRQKIECHLQEVAFVHQILPIFEIKVEVASFDIQKIKNPEIEGTGYQEGPQRDFWNVRQYVFFRDNYTCQCCKGKSKDNRLNVHHRNTRKTDGNSPDALITLCETCHTGYHKGTVTLPEEPTKKHIPFRDAAFMGIMRWALYEELQKRYDAVSITYGYITKSVRIENGLSKAHHVDARCITGHPLAEPLGYYYHRKKVRCHNRQIHKLLHQKGVRKLNQAPYEVKGFRLFDKVLFEGQECFIFGRRSSGYFDLRKLDGTVVHRSASYKKLKLLERRKAYLTERRCVA